MRIPHYTYLISCVDIVPRHIGMGIGHTCGFSLQLLDMGGKDVVKVLVTVTEIFRGNDGSYDVEAEKSAVWGGVLRLCNRLYMRTYYLRYIVTLILYWLERPIRCT